MKNRYTILFLAILAVVLYSCDKDELPEEIHEEEVITTLITTLNPDDVEGNDITLTSRDLDGDGPNEPVVTIEGEFIPSTVYTGAIQVLNESDAEDVEDITEEVEEEGEEHQFFYITSGNTEVTTLYTDKDENNNPIGIEFKLTTGTDVNDLVLQIVLRHEPDKFAEGVSDGNIDNAGGETDISVTFSSIEFQQN